MSSFVKKCCVVTPCNLFYVFGGKGCNFFVFCDIFRRIATQKQLFLVGLRDCVALGMEDFSAYATLLDFGDNLRCMKQVAGLAGAPRNLLICRVILHKPCNLAGRACSVTGCRLASCAMQPRRQSLLGHGLSPRKLRHATSQAEPARSRAVAL